MTQKPRLEQLYDEWRQYGRCQLNEEDVRNKLHQQFSPHICDFRWNKDYTSVEVVALRWYDDASYIRYQSEDLEEK